MCACHTCPVKENCLLQQVCIKATPISSQRMKTGANIFGITKVLKTMSRKKAEKLYHTIMRELYREATPPVDWDDLMTSNEAVRKAFDFNEHYLPRERFEALVEANLKSSGLNKFWQRQVSISVYLGPSPTSYKKEEQ